MTESAPLALTPEQRSELKRRIQPWLEDAGESGVVADGEVDRLIEQEDPWFEGGEDLAKLIVTWRSESRARRRVVGSFGSTEIGSLYSRARQVAIARKLEADFAGIPEPGGGFYNIDDFRAEFLAEGFIEPKEVDEWIGADTKRWERVRDMANAINQEFGWSHHAAVIYTLTGLLPSPLPAIVVENETYHEAARRLVIRVDPNSTPEEVASEYKRARERFLEDHTKIQRPQAKTLAILLQEYDRRGDELGTWKDRMLHWNELAEANGRPDWVYREESDWRKFRLLVKDASERPFNAEWALGPFSAAT